MIFQGRVVILPDGEESFARTENKGPEAAYSHQ